MRPGVELPLTRIIIDVAQSSRTLVQSVASQKSKIMVALQRLEAGNQHPNDAKPH